MGRLGKLRNIHHCDSSLLVAGKGAGLKVKVQPGTHVASLETRQEMKLLTHNMLTSHVKGVKNGYPFKILVSTLMNSSSYHGCVCAG